MIINQLQNNGHVWGAWGRQFESAHPDLKIISDFQAFRTIWERKRVENWPYFLSFFVLFCPFLSMFCCKFVANDKMQNEN